MAQNLSLEKDKIHFWCLKACMTMPLKVLSEAGLSQCWEHQNRLRPRRTYRKNQRRPFYRYSFSHPFDPRYFRKSRKAHRHWLFLYCTNQVDLEAARELGIPVFNAPYSNTRSVAELVLAEIIMLMRGIPEKNAVVHRGGWNKSAKDSYEVRGKTLGIVGYGSIGTQLSVLAESLGMKVIYHDVVTKLPLGNATQVGSLEELLGKADVVTLHVPDLPNTRNMITATELAAMKPGAHLINAARGKCGYWCASAAFTKRSYLGRGDWRIPQRAKISGWRIWITTARVWQCDFDTAYRWLNPRSPSQYRSWSGRKFVRYSDMGDTATSVNFPNVSMPQKKARIVCYISKNVLACCHRLTNPLPMPISISLPKAWWRKKMWVIWWWMSVAVILRKAVEALKNIPETIPCGCCFNFRFEWKNQLW